MVWWSAHWIMAREVRGLYPALGNIFRLRLRLRLWRNTTTEKIDRSRLVGMDGWMRDRVNARGRARVARQVRTAMRERFRDRISARE